jgi:hypothetical protein
LPSERTPSDAKATLVYVRELIADKSVGPSGGRDHLLRRCNGPAVDDLGFRLLEVLGERGCVEVLEVLERSKADRAAYPAGLRLERDSGLGDPRAHGDRGGRGDD